MLSSFLLAFGSVGFLSLLNYFMKREKKDTEWGEIIGALKIALPVAIVEEFVFRIIPYKIWGEDFLVLFLQAFLFALAHFVWGMYNKKEELEEILLLFIGLFVLGVMMYILHSFHSFWNIAYHAGIIVGVTVLPYAEHHSIKYFGAWLIMIFGVLLLC